MRKAIYVACPGGRTGPWGMSRMVDEFRVEWAIAGHVPQLRILDTTGGRVEWARGSLSRMWQQPLRFGSAACRIGVAAMTGRMQALHLHTAERGSVMRKLLLLRLVAPFKVPVIIHMHAASFATFYEATGPKLRKTITSNLNRADRFVVLGQADYDYFTNVVGIDAFRLQIIPNGVRSHGLPVEPDNPRCHLLYLGTYTARKGLDDLISALSDPALLAMPWHLTMAGGGDPAPWKQKIEAAGLAGRVRVLGWVEPNAANNLVQCADLLVLPSHQEALPMVILEAMASARPVVATTVGCVAEAVTHEKTGLLVPPHDPPALRDALMRMVANPAERRTLGWSARSAYEQRFSAQRMTDAIAKLYVSLAEISTVDSLVVPLLDQQQQS